MIPRSPFCGVMYDVWIAVGFWLCLGAFDGVGLWMRGVFWGLLRVWKGGLGVGGVIGIRRGGAEDALGW